jgi:hypothetical protein
MVTRLLSQSIESLSHPWLVNTSDKFCGTEGVIFFGNMSGSIAS